MAKYTVEAAATQKDALDGQCVAIDTYCDTIKEAKARARHFLSDEYQRLAEMSYPLGYARVLRDGECVADFFRP